MSLVRTQIRTVDFKYGGDDPTMAAVGPYHAHPTAGQLYHMLKAGIGLADAAANDTGTGHIDSWFGSNNRASAGYVRALARKLASYLDSHIETIEFRCSNMAGSIAFACQQPRHTRPGGDPLGQLRKHPRIGLAMGFYGNRYSWGQKVVSILHELTHLTLGTKDAKLRGTTDVYGPDLCKKLKIVSPGDALTNAENWTFYLGSYQGALPLPYLGWSWDGVPNG